MNRGIGFGGVWAERLPVWQRGLNRFLQRSRYVLLGWLAGWVLAWLTGDDLVHEYLQLAQSVDQLSGQQTTSPLPVASAPTAPGVGAVQSDAAMDRLPGEQTVARVWPDLQQALSQQGLRVASLRPLPEPLAAPLPSQSVAVRLSGRFVDWQRAWASLSAAGPVWSLERLSVVPQPGLATAGPAARDAVQIDAVLRVWLRPGSHGPHAWPESGPAAGVPPERALVAAQGALASVTSGVPLFALAGGSSGAGAAPSGLSGASSGPAEGVVQAQMSTQAPTHIQAPLPGDPLQWPLARMRLAGIWQHGDERQAVLAAGPHAVRVRSGQRVAQEGLRVESVAPDSVQLRSPGGVRHVLNLEGGVR